MAYFYKIIAYFVNLSDSICPFREIEWNDMPLFYAKTGVFGNYFKIPLYLKKTKNKKYPKNLTFY